MSCVCHDYALDDYGNLYCDTCGQPVDEVEATAEQAGRTSPTAPAPIKT